MAQQSNVGYIILGLVNLSVARVRRVNAQIASVIIGGETGIFFSGDHKQVMTNHLFVAYLYKAAGFENEAVQI